ncbi:oxysterol-binding protein related protein [Saccharomycopsis crataegensis]|uniref:Oxysterol-binding protein related protein n=1 Tax=Saccharomycopsis crataegensis TaxID=43959 RepID=A0AAV5QH88_9ASCO|nr:oxysterol-binding protein related protein [Saccharomycopsis crataegensis]
MPLGLKVPKIGSASSSTVSSTATSAPVSSNTDDIDEVDDQGQSILMGIISQLRPGMDLSRITFPTFILERKSMLERITNQLQQPDIVLEAHATADPVQRFLLVVKWYLSGWHIAPKAVKKPLNPVLGEHFTAYWDLPNGQKAFYISEQTCHHPPKSSYFYMIPESHIRVDGTAIPKSRFLGNSTAAIMDGVSILKFLDIKDSEGAPETYTLTQPNMYARGILFGKLKLEMGDHMIVTCPVTGMSADIEFITKGFISGTYDAIKGTVKKDNEALYEISGKWNEKMHIKDLKTKKTSLFLDTTVAVPLAPKVRPMEEQGDFESRKLWHKVVTALGERDHEAATDEKFKIENYQRELAKKRVEDDVEFHPKLFKTVSNYDPSDKNQVEFVIYKNISEDADPQTQINEILSIAPILPGQEFTEEFNIPAYEKHKSETTATATTSAADPVPSPTV